MFAAAAASLFAASLTGTNDALAVLGGSLARAASRRQPAAWTPMGTNAWVLPPSSSTPWAAVHFVGGAGFGSAPQLCYSDLLKEIAERCGVVVVATPYDVDLDHWKLASAVDANFQSALSECYASIGLSQAAPVFRLGHSLGAKLLVLGTLTQADQETAAASDSTAAKQQLGLMGFNNFGIEESASFASSFVAAVQGGERGDATARQVLDAFSIARQLAAVAGTSLEVSPSPADLERAVAQRYPPGSSVDTHIWRFDVDELDSSTALLESLPLSAPRTVHKLPGGHLTPICFRLDPAELDPALGLLLGASFGGGGISIGQRSTLEPLCDSLCEWLWPESMAGGPRSRTAAALSAAGASTSVDSDIRGDEQAGGIIDV